MSHHVGGTPSLTQQRLLKLLWNSRVQIKKRHKVVRQLHHLAIANNHVWTQPESIAKYEFLFESSPLKKVIDITHLKLSSSSLLKEIHSHPIEFANVVVGSCHETFFLVLVNHTVPAAYGFFSCDEMLDAAAEFYCQVIDCCCDVRLMTKIVMPILTSLTTFRFCESVFDDFFRCLASHSKRPNFIDFIIKYFGLLPPQITRLLRKISENFKTSFYFGKVFFGFLQQCAELWLPSCPHYHDVTRIQELMENLSKSQDCVDKVKHLLFTRQSLYSLPSIISFPDRPVMKLDLSMADMRNIAVLLTVMKCFPDGMHLAEFTKIREAWEPHSFSIALYFQATPERTVKMTHSLFNGVEKNVIQENEFERLSQAELLLDELDRHIELAKLYQELVMGRCISRAIKESAEQPLLYLTDKAQGIPRLHRKLILMRITPTVLKVRQKWKRTMAELDKSWATIISRMKGENTKHLANTLTPRVKGILRSAIQELGLLDDSILADRFSILLSVFRAVEVLHQSFGDSVYFCVFESASCKTLVSSVLQVNVFGMSDRAFISRCPEADNRTWLRLEAAITKCFGRDSDVLEIFTKSQLRMSMELQKV